MRAAKKDSFSAAIASTESWPAQLFCVVKGLLYLGPSSDGGEYSVAHCDQFTIYRKDIGYTIDRLETG